MLSLSNTTGYAVQALACLSHCDPEWHLAKDIADCSGAPLAYLQKVLSQLSEVGLVEGKRGYRGGFRLSRPADEITLMQVAEIVDPDIREPKCLLGFKSCSDEDPCPSHSFWKKDRERLIAELQRLTIRDIADFTFQSPTLPKSPKDSTAREMEGRIESGRLNVLPKES